GHSRVPEYQLLGREDVLNRPDIEWRVKHVLPARGLAQIFGPSKSGKSFLTFDLCAAIAGGYDWFDYKVTQAPVVFIALEGQDGMKGRVQAWEQKTGKALPADFHMILQPWRANDAEFVEALGRVIPQEAVVVVDTMARAIPGSDENSA